MVESLNGKWFGRSAEIGVKTISYRFKILPKSLQGIPLPLCGIGMTGGAAKTTPAPPCESRREGPRQH